MEGPKFQDVIPQFYRDYEWMLLVYNYSFNPKNQASTLPPPYSYFVTWPAVTLSKVSKFVVSSLMMPSLITSSLAGLETLFIIGVTWSFRGSRGRVT